MTNLEAAAHTALPSTPAVPTRPSLAGYRILRAWQRALDVAARAHRLAHALPTDEQHTLAADLRRAGAAVPTHIAAGNLSYDPVEHRRALLATQTALARVETLALLAEHLALAPAVEVAALLADSADTLRLVRALARVVGERPGAGHGPTAQPRTVQPRTVSESTPAHRLVGAAVPPAVPPSVSRPPARATRTRRAPRSAATTAIGAVAIDASATPD